MAPGNREAEELELGSAKRNTFISRKSFQKGSTWCHDNPVKKGQQSRKRLERGRTLAKRDSQRAGGETWSSGAWQHNAGRADTTSSCPACIKAPRTPLISWGVGGWSDILP